MEIKFRGGEADEGRLELHDGAESLAGIGRALNLVGHYVAVGKVRYKAPYSNKVRFLIADTEEGSLRVLIDEVLRLSSDARNAAASKKVRALLRRVIARATGNANEEELQVDGEIISSGDIDALAEAATPGLLRAHRWIDQRAKSISITEEGARPVRLDQETKDYLQFEEVSLGRQTQDVSVGALNVNSRSGRVFFHNLGRTVPFYVSRTANPRTIPTLSRYLTQYAEKTGATVNINFQKVEYADGRLKRIIVHDCFGIRDAA